MTPLRYSLADVDGTLCVRCETSDYVNPSIVTHYWPTTIRTRDAMRFYFDSASADVALLATLTAKQSIPGEYFIGIKDAYSGIWRAGQHVRLIDGPRTLPVKTDVVDAPTPKVRKGTDVYWSSGCWVKRTKTKTEQIDPLTVS